MSKEDLKVNPVDQEVTKDDLRKVHGGNILPGKMETCIDLGDAKDCKCHSPRSFCSSSS